MEKKYSNCCSDKLSNRMKTAARLKKEQRRERKEALRYIATPHSTCFELLILNCQVARGLSEEAD